MITMTHQLTEELLQDFRTKSRETLDLFLGHFLITANPNLMSDAEIRALFNRGLDNNLSTIPSCHLERMNGFCMAMKIVGIDNREYNGTPYQLAIISHDNIQTCEMKFSSFRYCCLLNEVGPIWINGFEAPQNASPKVSTITEYGKPITEPLPLFQTAIGTDVIYEYDMRCLNNFGSTTNIFMLSKSTDVNSMRSALYRTQYYLLKLVSTYPLNLMPNSRVWDNILGNLQPYFEEIFLSEYHDKILLKLSQCEQILDALKLYKEPIP
jgi:hypothetical protein